MRKAIRRYLEHRIAQAIQKVDKYYFFENYQKQAEAVLQAIDEAGFIVARRQPTLGMLKIGAEVLKTGRHYRADVVRMAYITMIEKGLNEELPTECKTGPISKN